MKDFVQSITFEHSAKGMIPGVYHKNEFEGEELQKSE